MTIRRAELKDLPEFSLMLSTHFNEVYSNRKINTIDCFIKEVKEWYSLPNIDLMVTEASGELTGFSVCFIDSTDNLTEPVYNCAYAYVKSKYRKGRSAYLLYNYAYRVAKGSNLKIVTTGRIENGVDKMIEKHFDLTPKFTVFEG